MENHILDEDFSMGNRQNDFDRETVKNINLTKIDLNEAIKHIKYGQGAFVVLLFFTTVALITNLWGDIDEETWIGIIFQSVLMYLIYGTCLIGSRFNAKAAMIVGFSAYALLLLLLDVILEPASLYRGIIIKILMLFFMGRAVGAAFKIDQLKEKLSALGVSSKELEMIKQLKDLPRTEHRSESQGKDIAPIEKTDPPKEDASDER